MNMKRTSNGDNVAALVALSRQHELSKMVGTNAECRVIWPLQLLQIENWVSDRDFHRLGGCTFTAQDASVVIPGLLGALLDPTKTGVAGHYRRAIISGSSGVRN